MSENSTKYSELIEEPHKAVVSVLVHVLDANDNRPEFDLDIYEVKVREGSKGEVVLQVLLLVSMFNT